MDTQNELATLMSWYQQLLQSVRFDAVTLDYSRLEYFKTLLDQLDVVDTSLLSIFDMSVGDHIYFSKKYASILGWDLNSAHDEGVAYVNQRFHPDDMLTLTRAGIYFLEWAFNLPVSERKKFKHISSYRMLDGNAHYVPVVEQQSVLELDPAGNIWLVLSVIDLAPASALISEATAYVQHIETGELTAVPGRENEKTLSVREREIMQLIAHGLASKQVAERLFLSVHTVNTHRQRILEKTGVANIAEAVRWAASRGLL